eukprot:IDg22859t1
MSTTALYCTVLYEPVLQSKFVFSRILGSPVLICIQLLDGSQLYCTAGTLSSFAIFTLPRFHFNGLVLSSALAFMSPIMSAKHPSY